MKKQIKYFVIVFLMACVINFAAVITKAELITFEFEGTVTYSQLPYGLDIKPGDLVAGSISYDPVLPPVYDTGSVAGYNQPLPSGMNVVIGGATLQSINISSLQVQNNLWGSDGFNGYYSSILFNEESLPGSMSFNLSDNTGTTLSSTALPLTLNAANFSFLSGGVYDPTTNTVAWFNIDFIGRKIITKIDIKPGGFPNSFNSDSKGNIPVAILTTDANIDNTITFDATTVDPETVFFGAIGTEAYPIQYDWYDVDKDGDTDLIFHFNNQETGINCGDVSAILTGATFDGQIIIGTDSVNVVDCE